jgi:hypothetical protein
MAGRDLAGPDHALGALATARLEAQHDVGVVVQHAPGAEGGQVGGESVKFEIGDAREIIGMSADVAGRAASARLLGIGTPGRLFLAGRLDGLGQPILRIFRLYDADVAKLALRHHLARLPHHGIAGVVVRQDEELAGFLDQRGSFFASASVEVSGLSQMTWMPASRNALAAG